MLLQDGQPGLEVFRDGRWWPVEPIAGALVINIGDIVQVWSNDRYQGAAAPRARQRRGRNASARRSSSARRTRRTTRRCRRRSTRDDPPHYRSHQLGPLLRDARRSATTPTTAKKFRSRNFECKERRMAFIDTTDANDATGEVRAMYERQQTELGLRAELREAVQPSPAGAGRVGRTDRGDPAPGGRAHVRTRDVCRRLRARQFVVLARARQETARAPSVGSRSRRASPRNAKRTRR